MGTLSFNFITTWVDSLVTLLSTNATTIITALLALVALVVGAFWLIGLGKKAVRQAK